MARKKAGRSLGGELQDHMKAAWQAHARGDRIALDKALERARACHPDMPVAQIGLLEAEVLLDGGHAGIGRNYLQVLARAFPDNPWPLLRLARLDSDAGDVAGAEARLTAAIGRDPENQMPELRRMQIEIRIEAGDEAAVRRFLDALSVKAPWIPQLYLRLSELAKSRGDPAAALDHLEAGLKAMPGNTSLHLACARIEARDGNHDAVIGRLRPLAETPGAGLAVMMPLIWAYREQRRIAEEIEILELAIRADPLDPEFLRYFFAYHSEKTEPAVLDEALSLLPGRVDRGLADEIMQEVFLKRLRFDKVLQQRRKGSGPHGRGQVYRLARVLIGGQKVRHGLRYLRLAMRRWPEDHRFLWLFVTTALKLGRFDDATAAIDRAAPVLPPATLLQLRFRLNAQRNDIESCIEDYAELRGLGGSNTALRETLSMMIYTGLDPARAEAVYARIGKPGEKDTRPRHSAGLTGQMAMEFEMERTAYTKKDGCGGLEAWVAARPESPIPAIRLIDAWRAASPYRDGPEAVVGDAIPRQIFQYLDAPDPPEAVAGMLASWNAATDGAHRVFDRRSAQRFLRENFGTPWGRAFRLGHKPAEGIDLLRLCVLIKNGGIWADAGDFLYGDLDAILVQASGLTLCREPAGGALAVNFIAAPPGHPVLKLAARLAAQALLQRGREEAWNKTGSGVLTRAVAQYLVQTGAEAARGQVTILDYEQVARHVSMHNQTSYEMSSSRWDFTRSRPYTFPLWPRLVEKLGAAPEKAAKTA